MKLLFFKLMCWLDDRVNHPLEDILPDWYAEHIGWAFCNFASTGICNVLFPEDTVPYDGLNIYEIVRVMGNLEKYNDGHRAFEPHLLKFYRKALIRWAVYQRKRSEKANPEAARLARAHADEALRIVEESRIRQYKEVNKWQK